MIPMLFAATSVGVIAFIAAFHMTDAFVLRERSIAYGYSVASEVRSGGIQLAVRRFHDLGHLQRRSFSRSGIHGMGHLERE